MFYTLQKRRARRWVCCGRRRIIIPDPAAPGPNNIPLQIISNDPNPGSCKVEDAGEGSSGVMSREDDAGAALDTTLETTVNTTVASDAGFDGSTRNLSIFMEPSRGKCSELKPLFCVTLW